MKNQEVEFYKEINGNGVATLITNNPLNSILIYHPFRMVIFNLYTIKIAVNNGYFF